MTQAQIEADAAAHHEMMGEISAVSKRRSYKDDSAVLVKSTAAPVGRDPLPFTSREEQCSEMTRVRKPRSNFSRGHVSAPYRDERYSDLPE